MFFFFELACYSKFNLIYRSPLTVRLAAVVWLWRVGNVSSLRHASVWSAAPDKRMFHFIWSCDSHPLIPSKVAPIVSLLPAHRLPPLHRAVWQHREIPLSFQLRERHSFQFTLEKKIRKSAYSFLPGSVYLLPWYTCISCHCMCFSFPLYISP